VAFKQRAVSFHAITFFQDQLVALDDVAPGDAPLLTIANDQRTEAGQVPQSALAMHRHLGASASAGRDGGEH
jgi:hypothetical protein